MAEEISDKKPSMENIPSDKNLKETIDDEDPPREPKLDQQELMNTLERSKVPIEGDTQESIVSDDRAAGDR